MNNDDMRIQLDQILSERVKLTQNDSEELILNRINMQATEVCSIAGANIVHPYLARIEEYDFLVIINCHAFTLNFWTSETFCKTADTYLDSTGGDNLIDYFFMSELIRVHDLHPLVFPSLNCVAIYADKDGKIKHSGVITDPGNNIVKSKWGVLPVFQHDIWNVPKSYGTEIKFYTLPSDQDLQEFYDEYLKVNNI